MNHSHGSTQQITYNLIIRWIIHLAGKDDDLFDDACSLVLEELLNDAAADGTSPNDCKVCVSGHELTLIGAVRNNPIGATSSSPPVFIPLLLGGYKSPRRHAYSRSCSAARQATLEVGRWGSFTLPASVHENRIHNESPHGDRSNWGELR
jgi:hypothetical protein